MERIREGIGVVEQWVSWAEPGVATLWRGKRRGSRGEELSVGSRL
jgi:hypothetical protein